MIGYGERRNEVEELAQKFEVSEVLMAEALDVKIDFSQATLEEAAFAYSQLCGDRENSCGAVDRWDELAREEFEMAESVEDLRQVYNRARPNSRIEARARNGFDSEIARESKECRTTSDRAALLKKTLPGTWDRLRIVRELLK